MDKNHAQKLVLIDEDCKPGVERAVWDGGPFTVVRYRYEPGASFPVHQHDSSQITVSLSGVLTFHIEGEDITIQAGESVYIPGSAPHSAHVPTDSERVETVNIFTPPRKEHP